MVQIFAPAFVILFFAVSPMQAFFGDPLTAGQETTEKSFICPMGIEWQAGSEQYLSAVFGGNHTDHAHEPAVPQDDINHEHMNHMTEMDHAAHMDMDHSNPVSLENTESKPEPCPIEQVLMFFSNAALYNIALFYVILLLIYFAIISQRRKILCFFTSRRDLFNLFPLRQAPPAFV